ncbi:MAG: MFS transporter, partial [Streptomyces sp.]
YGPRLVSAVALLLIASATSGWVLIQSDTPLWLLELMFFVQGVGMALVIPSATESVMSTLPRERAGVGSAVTNTIRQIGGALGVAVLGSVISSVYRDELVGNLNSLPAQARGPASESLASTYAVVERLGLTDGAVLTRANEAFVDAMHWAAAGSLAATLAGVLVVLRWLPGRASAAAGAPQPEIGEGEAAARSADRSELVRTR